MIRALFTVVENCVLLVLMPFLLLCIIVWSITGTILGFTLCLISPIFLINYILEDEDMKIF